MRQLLNLFLLCCMVFTQYSYAQQYKLTQELALEGGGNAQLGDSQAFVPRGGVFYVLEQQNHEWVLVDTLRSPIANKPLGQDIAISNDQAIVPTSQTVYIYEKTSSGKWDVVQVFDSVASGEGIISSVAITKDYAFAGLSQDDGPNGEQWAGSVQVFQRSGSTWQRAQRLRASDTGALDFFGKHIEAEGNQLMVGNEVFLSETKSNNTAYIFTLDASGEWVETNQLLGFVETEDAEQPTYGFSGSVVAIGSPGETTGSGTPPGRVIIYEQKNGAWQQTTSIRASDAEEQDRFGSEVVLYGDSLLAVHTTNKGSYIYKRSSFGQWSEIQILRDYYIDDLSGDIAIANGSVPGSVAFFKASGNMAPPIVTEPVVYELTQELPPGVGFTQLDGSQAIARSTGVAYVLEQQNHEWVLVDTLRSPIANKPLGQDIAISNDQAIVSTSQTVYIYEKTSSGKWDIVQVFDSVASGEGIISSVAITKDYAFAGLSQDDGSNGEQWAGSVQVFQRSGSTWQRAQRLRASDTGALDFFGKHIEAEGNQLMVGNEVFLSETKSNNTAYIFTLDASGEWVETNQLLGFVETEDVEQPTYGFSGSVVAIGSPGETTGSGTPPGRVIIYEQKNGAWQQTTSIRASDAEEQDEFGSEVVLYSNGLLAVQTRSKGSYVYRRTGFGQWEETQILRDYYIIDLSDDVAVARNPASGTIAFFKAITPSPVAVAGFNLIDPTTDEIVQPIQDGDVINLDVIFSHGDDQFLNIQAVTTPTSVGSVLLELSGDLERTSRQNAAPYALFGDDDGDYRTGELHPGEYTLTATPYPERNFTGAPGVVQSVSFTIAEFGQITGLTLINANQDQAILEIEEGTVIDYAEYPGVSFNLRVDVSPEAVGSVGIKVSEEQREVLRNRIQNAAPYAAFGDNNGDYRNWLPERGRYTVEATSYELRNRGGHVLDHQSFTFEVVNTSDEPFARTEDLPSKSGLATEIQLYPNPVNDRLWAEVAHSEYFTLSIYNPMGQLVYQKEANESLAEEINFSNQQPGIYMAVFNSPTERIVRKLMVRK
ncbi:T9SS type A sorting domain-containing protein [Tunicatimonas pelagia]|uniref:T9SS type A sorting domain-containing protein n=1 Tax=Tunicatimonas pelagia TaxID=931531 RepID=UPI0026657F78|nr:T9SS type A sorting domain-containing protein [Tunicatimonas pelagia]WKN41044.1 T9SS type A sorting domain-containing protein [Tunicatimonas pelagia]